MSREHDHVITFEHTRPDLPNWFVKVFCQCGWRRREPGIPFSSAAMHVRRHRRQHFPGFRG